MPCCVCAIVVLTSKSNQGMLVTFSNSVLFNSDLTNAKN